MMVCLFAKESVEEDSEFVNRQPTKGGTLDTGKIVAELRRERDRLSRAIAVLEGQSPKTTAKNSSAPNRAASSQKRKGLTPEGRKRLSDMMKKRWAEKRKKGSKKSQ